MKPKVSVIIPTFNRANLIPVAIKSVINQTYHAFELIIVDDGSIDNTKEVVSSLRKDERIRYIWQENQERAVARNTGITASRGEYISFLDSDDEYLPNKLTAQISVLEENPDIGIVFGGCIESDETGEYSREIKPWIYHPSPEYSLKEWLFSSPIYFSVSMVRRTCLERTALFDPQIKRAEDIDLMFRLIYSGCKPAWVKEPVWKFKPHIQEPVLYRENYLKIIEKAYNIPGMEEKLGINKAQACAYAYISSAYYAFLSSDLSEGKTALAASADLDPSLAEYSDSRIVTKLVEGAWSAITDNPVLFIQEVFINLPDSLNNVRARRNWAYSRAWMSEAIRSYRNNHPKEARRAVLKAISNDPKLLFNRGMLAILGNSTFNLGKPARLRDRSRQPSESKEL